jgi:hypothetical protein
VCYILWHIDPLLSGDYVNRDRWYVTPAAYTYAVTSRNNEKDVASGVLRGFAPRL